MIVPGPDRCTADVSHRLITSMTDSAGLEREPPARGIGTYLVVKICDAISLLAMISARMLRFIMRNAASARSS